MTSDHHSARFGGSRSLAKERARVCHHTYPTDMAAELGWPRNVATDMPVLEIMDGSAGVVKLIPQELIERQTVEETVDVLVPQTQELQGVVKLIQQKRVQNRMLESPEETVDVSVQTQNHDVEVMKVIP